MAWNATRLQMRRDETSRGMTDLVIKKKWKNNKTLSCVKLMFIQGGERKTFAKTNDDGINDNDDLVMLLLIS